MGTYFNSTFKRFVLPELVAPLIKMFRFSRTSRFRLFGMSSKSNVISGFGAKDFSVRKESDSLYHFNIMDMNNEKTEFFVALYSGTDGEGDE